VKQQHVEVAVRAQFAAPVAADGDERDLRFVAEKRRQPAVGGVGAFVTRRERGGDLRSRRRPFLLCESA
jgi:hypothetical protein